MNIKLFYILIYLHKHKKQNKNEKIIDTIFNCKYRNISWM